MASQQVAHPHDHGYEQDPSSLGLHSHVMEGEDEHHHERKSVLKKVKAKARKLKDTITKHGHDHDHDRNNDHPEGHVPDDHDLDEEDDEEEDMVDKDPEVHGAPVYESAAVVSGVDPATARSSHGSREFGRPENLGKDRGDFERTAFVEEGVRAPANTPHLVGQALAGTQQAVSGDYLVRDRRNEESEAGQNRVNLARPGGCGGGLEEDSHSPTARRDPPNYQVKVTDPTASGAGVADVSPIIHSLGQMTVNNEAERKPETLHNVNLPSETRTGSHDQFSPEPISRETDASTQGVHIIKPETQMPEETEHKPSSPSTYTEKLSSATSAIAEKAVSAKNLVASKLGYGEEESTKSSDVAGTKTGSYGENPSCQSSYGEKISSATSVIADRAISAKNLGTSKLGVGEKDYTSTPHETDGTKSEAHLKPDVAIESEKKPEGQSSYTGKIVGTAVAAKDMVASKLGYGKKDDDQHDEQPRVTDQGRSITTVVVEKLSPVISKVTGSTGQGGEAPGEAPIERDEQPRSTEQGKSITAAVAEKLSPVISKVTGSTGQRGEAPVEAPRERDEQPRMPEQRKSITTVVAEKLSPVISKVTGSTGQRGEAVGEVPREAATVQTDKGVSVRDYWAEKLKPSEEDRALSEVISNALHKTKKGECEKQSEGERTEQVMGISEKGGGVVDKVKGAVGSWLVRSGGDSQAASLHASATGSSLGAPGELEEHVGERRLQESSN